MGDWDKSLKSLVADCPLAFAELILRELKINARGIKVVAQLDTGLQGYDLDADALLLITLEDGEEILVHIEFQSVSDNEMPDRLLEYCFRARKKYGRKPIVSCVIYLRDVGKVQEPPHSWGLKSGRKLMAFDYLAIKLHEEEADKLLTLNQPAILPLTLLTKGGASRTMVAGIFNELQSNGLRNLLPVTHLLANLVLKDNKVDLDWLERKYREMTVNFKDLPAYHWMTDDAYNEGREEGREEGLEKGRVESLRGAIASIIEESFPGVVKFAKKQLPLISHVAPLKKLVVNVHKAQTPEEVKRYLSEAFAESLEMD